MKIRLISIGIYLIVFQCFISCIIKNKEYKKISFNLRLNDENSGIINFDIEIDCLVKLESSDSTLIGEITKIKFYDDKIYILDRTISKSLYVFGIKGNFIGSTKRGKGPGECINPMDFMIDTLNQKVWLWDQAKCSMLSFDFELNFIELQSFNGVALENFEKINNDTLLVCATISSTKKSNNRNKKSYFSYAIYEDYLNIPVRKLLPIPEELISLGLNSPMSNNNRILFVAPFCNNIYGIEKNEARILYQLDFGKLNVTNKDIEKGIKFVFNEVRSGRKITSIDYPYENNRYLAFTGYYDSNDIFIIHSKRTGENYYSEMIFKEKKLPKCMFKGITSEGHFIAIANPENIKEFSFSKTSNQEVANLAVDVSDNPYILIFDLVEKN